jgi:hypothetical protein
MSGVSVSVPSFSDLQLLMKRMMDQVKGPSSSTQSSSSTSTTVQKIQNDLLTLKDWQRSLLQQRAVRKQRCTHSTNAPTSENEPYGRYTTNVFIKKNSLKSVKPTRLPTCCSWQRTSYTCQQTLLLLLLLTK